MDIGEVAKKAKVTTATLRFYEEKGLIKIDRAARLTSTIWQAGH